MVLAVDAKCRVPAVNSRSLRSNEMLAVRHVLDRALRE